jgi:protein-disulfide isomerase
MLPRRRTTLLETSKISLAFACALVLSVLVTHRGLPWFSKSESRTVRYGRLPVPSLPIRVDTAQVEGNPKARLAVILYSDFECSQCALFARTGIPVLREKYVEPGRLRLVFRHFPIERLHPMAVKAAVAAECAGKQGKFWEVHDRLFQLEGRITERNVDDISSELGLSSALESTCRVDELEAAVRTQLQDARQLQVGVTPTFFVGLNTAAGVVVRQRISGSALAPLLGMIDAELAALGTAR